ncbi:MAG: alginate lyase family protein [Actinobacteria bacterium]|nr:alginate lyase family protein [Actinomycetota bacterium]
MNKIKHYLSKAISMSFSELISKVIERINSKFDRNIKKIKAKIFGTNISNRKFLASLIPEFSSVDEYLIFKRNQKTCFYPGFNEKEFAVEFFSSDIDAVKTEAESICQRSFDLLGSGTINLGPKINWQNDFKKNTSWNSKTFYKDISIIKGDGSDIKVPWELSRFQHLTILGQAYWLTNDEKYVQGFVDQISDWIRENQPQFGVNWTCAMDVAIRAVNWIFGFNFFKDSSKITDEFLFEFSKSILLHGRYIMDNLEWSQDLTSNHYLSNIVGLIFIGVTFSEFKESTKWREFGVKELIKEMEKQVHLDGVDFEASTSYHRLVLELFFAPALLCRINKIELPDEFWQRLEKMFDFTLYCLKPNGLIPQIGDNDNGRLFKFREQDVLDHTYLLAFGAILFKNSKYKIEEFGLGKEAFWFFGKDGFETYQNLNLNSTKKLESKFFENAGLFIMRKDNSYMIVSCGPNGQNNNGGHAHNDKLSFELQIEGNDFIIDPGSYIYTPEPEWRNLFRSTAYHNTVMIDKEEQNRFTTYGLFQMENESKAECLKIEIGSNQDFFAGLHKGYTKLGNPVVHKREIIFDKRSLCWQIADIFEGEPERHEFVWHFHLAPDVEFSKENSKVHLIKNDSRISLSFSNFEQIDFVESWYSPQYGVKIKSRVIVCKINTKLPLKTGVEIKVDKSFNGRISAV